MTDLDNDLLAAGLARKFVPVERRRTIPTLKQIQAQINTATTELKADNDAARAREAIRTLVDGLRRIDSMCAGPVTPPAVQAAVIQILKDAGIPRFERTYCSQCGGTFGAGDHGYSHCSDHRDTARVYGREE